VITQIESVANAPLSISGICANGVTEVVSLSKFSGGVAHYVTTSNLDRTVVSATLVIYSGWSSTVRVCAAWSTTPRRSWRAPPVGGGAKVTPYLTRKVDVVDHVEELLPHLDWWPLLRTH
jgi:hypothetical protein